MDGPAARLAKQILHEFADRASSLDKVFFGDLAGWRCGVKRGQLEPRIPCFDPSIFAKITTVISRRPVSGRQTQANSTQSTVEMAEKCTTHGVLLRKHACL